MSASGTAGQTLDMNITVTKNGVDTCTELLREVDDILTQFDTFYEDLKRYQTVRIGNTVQQMEENEDHEKSIFEEFSTSSDILNSSGEKNKVNNVVPEELKPAGIKRISIKKYVRIMRTWFY